MVFNFRKSKELIITNSDTWDIIKTFVNNSKHDVKIISTTEETGAHVLSCLQVTTNSPLGAIAYFSGGITVDGGWVRILGAGGEGLPSITQVNGLNKTQNSPPGFIVCATDVVGGLFLIDGGGLGFNPGEIVYAEPETGEFTALSFGHGDFVEWVIDGKNLQKFYEHHRWSDWSPETKSLSLGETFSFFPPLSTVEGQNVETSSHRGVPTCELLGDNFRTKN